MTKIKIMPDWRNADKWNQWQKKWLQKWESEEMSMTQANNETLNEWET